MARRKFHRSKFQPDRGWLIGFNNMTMVKGDGVSNTWGLVFDFADIDAEALTGRIEQDKSDWFVKRVLLEAYAAFSTSETTPTDVARIWQFGMGIMNNDSVVEFDNDPLRVYSGETFNLMARTFRTWSRPVYAGGLIGYTGDFNIATENVTTGGPTGGYSTTAPFWGESSIKDDFEVTSAGLRNNQSCVFLVSDSEGPASFDWDEGDVLYVTVNYRVLLQKRRT